MKNACEWKSEYTPEGKCIRCEWAIGPIAVWAAVVLMVVIVLVLFGRPADVKELLQLIRLVVGIPQLLK